MYTSLFSGLCLSAIAFALFSGPSDERPLAPAERTAYSTITPAFIPHEMPVPDMVDIAIESALQQPATPASPSHPLDEPAPLDTSRQQLGKPNPPTQESAFQVATTYRVESTHRVAATHRVASNQRFAATHDALQNFNAILRPKGFQRPLWQDMEITAELGARDTGIEPFIVMIDPGHGGTDQGAKGHNGLLEKDLTLDIAKRVRLFLTEFKHIDVRLTRHYDHGLSRQSRVNAIQRSEADMVVSLHFNHLPQSGVNLVETFYAGPSNITQSLTAQITGLKGNLQQINNVTGMDLSFTKGSSRLARALQERIFNEVSFSDESTQNAGIKEETLFVLTRSFTPGILLEISCLSHAAEADRLESDEYRNRLAAALVDGIRDYHDSLQRKPLQKRGDIGV